MELMASKLWEDRYPAELQRPAPLKPAHFIIFIHEAGRAVVAWA